MPKKKRSAAGIAQQKAARQEWRRRKDPLTPVIEFFENDNGGMEVPRAGLLRQRFAVPAATHHLLTERQRTVLKGKVRMSRGWVRMERIMKDTGMTMAEFVAQLSVEELVRGKFRDKNGKMQGRPPRFVPREFQQACLKELMTRGQEMWMNNYLKAIEAMTAIATGEGPIGSMATPGERLKAAQFVVERMEGKVPERLVVTQDQPWQTVLDGIVAEVGAEAVDKGRIALEKANTEGIQEAEVVDVSYDEEEDEDPAPVRSRRRRPR
jgi:hypothetical protein